MVRKTNVRDRNIGHEARMRCVDVVKTRRAYRTCNFINELTQIKRLRQTADVNLYHVTKFPPYFPLTLYCFYTKISGFMPVLTIGIGTVFIFLFSNLRNSQLKSEVCRLR